jgi:Fe-S-cluster containining protein
MAKENSNYPPSPNSTMEISLNVGGATLHANVQLPASRTTLTALLPIIQTLENAIVDKVGEEAQAAGRPISCKAKCGACCRQMVPVSLFEAEALAEWVQTLPEEQSLVLRARFDAALRSLRDSGVLKTILEEEWMLDERGTSQLAIDYFHAGVPCPFLEEESCSIHPIRPLSCREYLVTSPPDLCRDPSVHNVCGVNLPVKLSRALFAFGQQIEQHRRGWIPLVFLLAIKENSGKPGDYFTGSGPEVLRRFLDQVAADSVRPNKGA